MVEGLNVMEAKGHKEAPGTKPVTKAQPSNVIDRRTKLMHDD
jgi:hypothetical protein